MARSDLGGGHSPLLGRLWSPKRGGGAGQAWEGTFSPLLPGVHFSLSQVLPCTWCPAPGRLGPLGWGWVALALAPALLPSSLRPEGGCWEPQPATLAPANRSPGGAGEGTGQRRRGWAGGLGFRGSRWERAWKEQMPPLPTGPARRPPALCWGCSCRRLPRSTAGGKGERHLGHRPLSDSRDTVLASPRRPHPASLQPSLRKPG